MPANEEELQTLKQVVSEGTDLNEKIIYVKTGTSSYHSIVEGIHPLFKVIVEEGEYRIEDFKHRKILETSGEVIQVRERSTNPYELDYFKDYKLDTNNKLEEVLRAVQLVVHKTVSYGGAFPYVSAFKEIFIGTPEVEPIGEAIIGDTFTIA